MSPAGLEEAPQEPPLFPPARKIYSLPGKKLSVSVTVGLMEEFMVKKKNPCIPAAQLSGCWFSEGSDQGHQVSSGSLWLIYCPGCPDCMYFISSACGKHTAFSTGPCIISNCFLNFLTID